MRHRADHNQNEIVKALEKIGCTVYKIGRPVDLAVGRGQKNWLLDCKSKKGKKTPFQDKFFAEWRGQADIVRSPAEAVDLINQEVNPVY